MALLIGACTTDPGGHLYSAYNEWDRAVVIRLSMSAVESLGVPARARGTLSSSFDAPTAEKAWHASVVDDTCRLLATVPLPAGHQTVHIDPHGAVEVVDSDSWDPPWPMVEWAPALEPRACPD